MAQKGHIVRKHKVVYESYECRSCGAIFSENIPCFYCDRESFRKWIKSKKENDTFEIAKGV